MKILILKSLTTHNKRIDFSKISLEEQMWYITKETEELDNSVSYLATHDTQKSKEDVAQEDLDVIQTCIQQLKILESQGVDLEKAVDEHNKKLLEKRDGVVEQTYFLQNIEKDKIYVIDNKNREKGNCGENRAILNEGMRYVVEISKDGMVKKFIDSNGEEFKEIWEASATRESTIGESIGSLMELSHNYDESDEELIEVISQGELCDIWGIIREIEGCEY